MLRGLCEVTSKLLMAFSDNIGSSGDLKCWEKVEIMILSAKQKKGKTGEFHNRLI